MILKASLKEVYEEIEQTYFNIVSLGNIANTLKAIIGKSGSEECL